MVRKCREGKGIVEGGVSSTYMQLRSRRIIYVRSGKDSSAGDNNRSSSSSCCASNENKNNEFIDLEENDKDGDTETSTYQRGMKRKVYENLKEESENMENYNSSEFESAIKDCCCTPSATTEQPTGSEIEDFFMEAEKQLYEKFTKKYNFDFEKEKPLEGRYEWVKLK